MIPFGMSATTTTSAPGAAPQGHYDAEQQLWVGGPDVEAGVCTGATICVGPICYKYTRMFDVAAICVW